MARPDDDLPIRLYKICEQGPPQAKLYVSNWIKKVEAEPGLTRNKCDKVFLWSPLEPQVSISSA